MRRSLVVLLPSALGLAGCAGQGLVADPRVRVPIEDVLTAIRCEFVEYVSSQRSRFNPKKPWVIQGKLVVSAETGTSGSIGGTLVPFSGNQTGLLGLSLSAENKQTSTSTIEFDLDPGTKLKGGSCLQAQPGFGIAAWLGAVERAKAATDGLALRDKSYVFGLAFAVTTSGKFNGSFGVHPIGIDAAAARRRDDIQTLTIAIKPKPELEVVRVQIQPAKTRADGSRFSDTFALPGSVDRRAVPVGRYIYRPVDLGPELDRKRRELLGDP